MIAETERLRIEEFTPEMAQAVHENSLDEDNRRFPQDEVFETPGEAAETVAFLMSCYGGQEGPFVYPVLLKDGTVIGHVQAVPLEGGGWEAGYHIAKRYARNGYATEALRAFLPVVMKNLGIREIRGICAGDNTASRRVMEKCGFAPDREEIGWYKGEQKKICFFTYRL